jgi:hypothetical protein
MNKMKINKYCLWLNIVGCIGVAIILLYDQTIGLRFRIYGALMVSFTVMFGCLLLSKKTKIIKIDRITTKDDWKKWIGLNIIKRSNKPFKSGLKIGIPLGMELNPYSGKMAFKMDDGSIVDCHQCKLVE